MILTIQTANPAWFISRASGVTSMVLLTLSVCLGVVTSIGWKSLLWPRFLTSTLHRNLSVFVMVFLPLHIITAIVDPYAGIKWRDAVIPFMGSYRPLWLGLGTVAFLLVVSLVITSLMRTRIGPDRWRIIHWLSYAAWFTAFIHGLGTASDAREWWGVGLSAGCFAAVLASAVWRVAHGWRRRLVVRAPLAGLVGFLAFATLTWSFHGPLAEQWTLHAGRPGALLGSMFPPTAAAVPQWSVAGRRTITATGSSIALTTSPSQYVIRIDQPAAAGSQPHLTITKNSKLVCDTTPAITTSITARCKNVDVYLDLNGTPDNLGGIITVSGQL